MDPNALAAASSTNLESRAANKYRFELELEFVQSLANPHYLQALAQQGIMEDPSFVLYLDYLRYWSEPEYAKFIIYPHALHHLQLLQNPRFRADLKAEEVLQLLVEKQFDHWRTWRSAPIQSLPTSSLLAQAETQDSKQGLAGSSNGGGSSSAAPRTSRPGSRRETPLMSSVPMAGTPRPVSNTPTSL